MTKADRDRAERHAERRRQKLADGQRDVTDATTLAAAIAAAIVTYHHTQVAHIPTGGGYALPATAEPLARFITASLTEGGWTA